MSDNSLDNHVNVLLLCRFLRILILLSGIILLAACQVTQATFTPIPSTTPTSTASETATRIPDPTDTPPPTATATLTPTPTPVVMAEPWVRNREGQDKTLPQLMFPYIGGVNHVNRQGLDMRFGELNLAFVQNSQPDDSEDLQALRETYAEPLNQDPKLLEQLASIQQQLEGTDNITVVIEDGQITQVATKPYQTITRYVLENGILREMTAEEEPQLLPELYVDGTEFKRVDTEEVVRLNGVVSNHFIYGTNLSIFKSDVDLLKSVNGNFIHIFWDASKANNSTYQKNLADALSYAKQKGLRIELSLRANGFNSSDYSFIDIPIGPDIHNYWDLILDDDVLISSIKRNVDIINPYSEPDKNTNGRYTTFSEIKPIFTQVINKVRDVTGKNIIGLFSGISFGGDPRSILTNPPNIYNWGIEVHPYKWIASQYDLSSFLEKAAKDDTLVLAGEMGLLDDPEYNNNLYGLFDSHGIGFAFAALNTASDNPNAFAVGSDLTNGEQAAAHFSGMDETR